jgi:hypothetical protein
VPSSSVKDTSVALSAFPLTVPTSLICKPGNRIHIRSQSRQRTQRAAEEEERGGVRAYVGGLDAVDGEGRSFLAGAGQLRVRDLLHG